MGEHDYTYLDPPEPPDENYEDEYWDDPQCDDCVEGEGNYYCNYCGAILCGICMESHEHHHDAERQGDEWPW